VDIRVIDTGSSGNAYVIGDGSTSVLIEAGIPIKQIRAALDYKLCSSVSACFITHEHKDHCKAVYDLIKFGVICYASEGTWNALDIKCGHFSKKIAALGVGSPCMVDVGTLTVRAFELQHDAAEPLGFLIDSKLTGERVLYFTDTYYLKNTFTDVTHVLAECNYDAETLSESIDDGTTATAFVPRVYRSHMSLETLIKTLKANDLSRI